VHGTLADPEPLAGSRIDFHQREREALRIPCQQCGIGVGKELALARDRLPDQQR
jgi:hypothetical protein